MVESIADLATVPTGEGGGATADGKSGGPSPRRACKARRLKTLIEQCTGQTFRAVCETLYEQGLTRREAATELGAKPYIFHAALQLYLPDLDWGRARPRRSAATQKTPEVISEEALWRLAQAHRLSYHLVWRRYLAGLRGEALAAPRQPGESARASYGVGFTMRMWEPVLELARERGPVAAARMKDLPLGAVLAMLHGEEELVG